MILDQGDKLLVSHRRLFESEAPRFFLGEVEEFDAGLVKVRGNTWTRDYLLGEITRKEGVRRKLIAISSGMYIVYQLDEEIDLDAVAFDRDTDGRLWLTDGRSLRLDLSERILRGHHGETPVSS